MGFINWSRSSHGKHERDPDQCNTTWGTCDVRSNDPDANSDEQILPHVCGETGGHGRHICLACSTAQA